MKRLIAVTLIFFLAACSSANIEDNSLDYKIQFAGDSERKLTDDEISEMKSVLDSHLKGKQDCVSLTCAGQYEQAKVVCEDAVKYRKRSPPDQIEFARTITFLELGEPEKASEILEKHKNAVQEALEQGYDKTSVTPMHEAYFGCFDENKQSFDVECLKRILCK